MAYWTTIEGYANEKHDTLLEAGIRIRFAVKMSEVNVDTCAIYKRDPAKHPDEPNILPAQIRKAQRGARR